MDPVTEASAFDAGQGESGTPSSLLSQKRPRDYGERLKGLSLSQSEDEGAHNSASFPSSKKQKVHADTGDDSGLDDGEIVESSPAPGPQQVIPVSQESLSDVKMHEPSEDGEVGSASAEPEGRIHSTPSEPTEPFFIDKLGSKPVPHSGWNQGVSRGTRTSFGKAPTQLFPASMSGGTEPTVSSTTSPRDHEDGSGDENKEDNNDECTDKKKTKKPKTPTGLFVVRGKKGEPSITWKLPLDPRLVVKTKNCPLTPAFWAERLKLWVDAVLQVNPDMANDLTPRVIEEGYAVHLSRKEPRLLEGVKKRKASARAAAERAMASADLPALVAAAREPLKAKGAQAEKPGAKEPEVKEPAVEEPELEKPEDEEPEVEEPKAMEKDTEEEMRGDITMDDDSEADTRVFPTGEEELRLQKRYFPGAEDPSQHCLNCGAIGHHAYECPLLTCKFCGSKKHIYLGCPTKKRCQKCYRIGHKDVDCKEKLKLAPEERDPCAFCGAEHTEDKCSELWRTYKPSPETTRKVKHIPAFCYTCGAEGHYGPECALPDRGGKVTGFTSWSQANRDQYVDPNSPNEAIAWAGVDRTESRNGEFHIRGRAHRQVHTHFVSSDDSEEDLVHAPINRPGPRNNNIRIASNISHPQPPLPPGPPPPNGSQGPFSSAPPASLPPRPQTINYGGTNQSHNQNQQSRGGNQGANRGGLRGRGGQNHRGGRGGRGGGRGRGGPGRGRGRGRGDSFRP